MRVGLMSLSGHNHRAVVALCRWAAAAQVPLHLIARDAADPLYLTDYASLVCVQRRSPALDVAEVVAWVAQLRKQHGYAQVMLAPSTEFFNRVLLRHRAAIEAAGGLIPLVGQDLYELVSDKQSFDALCIAHGIAVPAVFDQVPEQLPFVAKPRHYLSASSGQVKPYLVFTSAERERFLRREAVERFFFQEFVEGESLYLLAHISRSGKVIARAQENLMQQAAGGSIILARAHGFHEEPAAQLYLDMLIRVGFHGLVMVEVRRCRRTGRAVMIEANPRMWGPLQFMLDQQADPLAPLCEDHGLEVPIPAVPGPAQPYYFWSGGLSRTLPSCTFHNFSPDQFVADYPRIAAADLFARDDTRRLHQHELVEA